MNIEEQIATLLFVKEIQENYRVVINAQYVGSFNDLQSASNGTASRVNMIRQINGSYCRLTCRPKLSRAKRDTELQVVFMFVHNVMALFKICFVKNNN